MSKNLIHTEAQLAQLAQSTLEKATKLGATSVEIGLGESWDFEVGVRDGKPENINSSQHLSVAITVYIDQKQGEASSNSFAPEELERTCERAIAIAKQMNDDDCNGLPDTDRLATDIADDLDQYHPWEPSVDEALQIANEMAQASWEVSNQISKDKSEGAGVSVGQSRSVLANTSGFCASKTKSSSSLVCIALAEFPEGMETASWHDDKIARKDLEDHISIGTKAGKRAAARGGAKPIKSQNIPVLFETGAAHSLMGALCSGIAGGPVYRKLTYLANELEKQICASHINLSEQPHLKRRGRSSYYDSEGVATTQKKIVSDGVLNTFLLGSYSARKLKSESTGNSGGVRNLLVEYEEKKLSELMQEMKTGLFVTSTMGKGANFVTGDYSIGASGFWIENGEIAFPVKDATVAGQLPQLYKGIVAGGSDRRILGGIDCGSLLVEQLAVGGSQ